MPLPIMTPAQVINESDRLEPGGVVHANLDAKVVSKTNLQGLKQELEKNGFKVRFWERPDFHEICVIRPTK